MECRAQRSEIVMQADAFHIHLFSIEDQTLVFRELKPANPER